MYAVVGCDECSALWILEGRPERTECPRCGRTRGYEKRRKFVTTEDKDHAREVRASMLASRQGHDDAFAELDSFAELDAQIEDSGIDDETYLQESGLDATAVQNVADDSHSTRSKSSKEIVREAIDTLDTPGQDEIIAYAQKRDVPKTEARRLLEKLVRAGDVSRQQDIYRLL